MDKHSIYVLLEIEAKNHLLVKNLEKIGFKIDDPIYCMLETNYGSIDDILTEYFDTHDFGIWNFMNDYLDSFGDECGFEMLDGKEMYEEALKYFNITE